MSPLAEEKLPETSSDCVAIGPVQTPKDSLPKQVLGSSKGTLDSVELLEGRCGPVALAAGAMVGKGKLHQTPAQRRHLAHYLDTAVLVVSPGYSFRHYVVKCETRPPSEECLDRFRTIQWKKELHCPSMHFSSKSIYYAACRSSLFSSHAPKYISVRAQQAIAVGIHCLAAPQKNTTHSKETHFMLQREVGFLPFTVSGTLLALSLSLHKGCQGQFTLLYSSNYPKNVCEPLLCVKSFSLQSSLIF